MPEDLRPVHPGNGSSPFGVTRDLQEPANLVASTGAGICERFSSLRDKFPLISAGREGQLQDAERFERVDFAMGANDSERTQILAAGSDNEFADAASRVSDAVRILWRE